MSSCAARTAAPTARALDTWCSPRTCSVAGSKRPIVLAGLRNTVLLSLLVVPLGLFGGLILALLASAKNPAVRWPLMAWVDFFRAFPPLVLLILLFAGLPFAGPIGAAVSAGGSQGFEGGGSE